MVAVMGIPNKPITPIAAQCSSTQLSSVRHDRGWLLGVERTAALKRAMETVGSLLGAAGIGDRALLDRLSSQARITLTAVMRELDSEEPEGPPVVTIVSIETLHAFLGLPQEPEAAVDFIKTYGVFRPEDTRSDSRRPQFVRDFWHDTKRDGARPVVLKLYDFWYPQVRLTMVLDLYTALRSSSRLLKKSVEWDRQIDPGVLPCSQYC